MAYRIINYCFWFAVTVADENTYILTTDADVRFTHESVEALLDLMARDPTVGAVCGRTHPLGVGPIVWYQVFDYAIGHWFQKVHRNYNNYDCICSTKSFITACTYFSSGQIAGIIFSKGSVALVIEQSLLLVALFPSNLNVPLVLIQKILRFSISFVL